MELEFEWDPQRAEANARKHGVTFSEATTAFRDPLSVTVPDIRLISSRLMTPRERREYAERS